jgi:hypothetical protein
MFLEKLKNFFVARVSESKPNVAAKSDRPTHQPAAAAPAPVTPAAVYKSCGETISHPEPGSPWYDELMAGRARDFQWGMAVAAKVAQWQLLISMGSGHVVPQDYRERIMQAMATNDYSKKSLLYNLIQTNIMRNYPSIAQVKAL